jgi:hypothetical protein
MTLPVAQSTDIPITVFKRRKIHGLPSGEIDIRSQPPSNVFSQTSLSVARSMRCKDSIVLIKILLSGTLTAMPFTLEGVPYGMKAFCCNPFYKSMIVVDIENKNTMSTVTEIIANAWHGNI